MVLYTRNNKVYTADTKALIDAEDVGVEGKRYPTNALGRAVAQHHCLMLLTMLVPIVFFVIGWVYIDSRMEYSLQDFQLRPIVEAQRSAERQTALLNQWTDTISGADRMQWMIDRTRPRTSIQDQLEMRTRVDVEALQRYCAQYNINYETEGVKYLNLLNPSNFYVTTAVHAQIRLLNSFKQVCFSNDLEFGVINAQQPPPDCVPPTGLSQYVWPRFNGSEVAASYRWHMDGMGGTAQVQFLPRIFVNPNYPWFFDANFSTTNQVVRQLRTGFVLASSPGQSRADYQKKAKAFVKDALNHIKYAVGQGFLRIAVGGPLVENLKIEEAASSEGYKVAIVFALASILSWWHCGSFVMGLYAGAQVIFTYLAAVGLYALIYKSLPLMTFSAVIWVMTFGLHGTLSFYDMFVYSGVMATKGRQNNLSVPQRVCFTIRRITLGVWLANVLAIVIFAINTTSVFDSVRQFSIFMMIAFLWNMYFIALPTPAYVCMHHFYFSNKRRNLQKQVDVLNVKAAECRRAAANTRVLAAVQANVSVGEAVYALDADVLAARIGANRGINKRRYKGVGDFLVKEMREGMGKLHAAREDVTGAVHKTRKTRRQVVGGMVGTLGLAPEAAPAPPPLPKAAVFEMDAFAEVALANPFANNDGQDNDSRAATAAHRSTRHASTIYFNKRMVRHADVIHVPPALTERSEACWETMCNAIKQRNKDGPAAPHIYSLRTVGDNTRGQETFAQRWSGVADELTIAASQLGMVDSCLPLLARATVRAQDPLYVIGGRHASTNASTKEGDQEAAEGNDAAAAPAQTAGVVDPGSAGFGLRKLRHRWARRGSGQQRSRCCGLCGGVRQETAEQRMQRLMSRQVKREGYTLLERFLIRAYVPFVHLARWVLLALLVVLFILVIIFGSHIKAAGIPTSLMTTDDGSSAAFAAMDGTFGQRGSCTFCGPYYRSVGEYRTSSLADVTTCIEQMSSGPQMNVYVDSCGVCNGANDCLDCAGTPNGMYVKQCNGCEAPGTASCSCENSRACTYCQWALSIANSGGSGCSVACDASTCKNGGSCDQYTGKCNCVGGFAGDTCEACAAWLLPITANPRCYLECTITYDSPSCRCLSSSNQCSACPSGTRGYLCDQPALDCGAHGTFSTTSLKCVCSAGWGGELCEASEQCNLRGPLLSAAESPTGAELCACKGHWRGPTCQLCDCLNGGMCDDSTGKCACRGAFTGARCQTCDATCVAHGRCPSVLPAEVLNIRTCIEEHCDDSEKAAETTCRNCPGPTTRDATCGQWTSKQACNLRGSCWWVADSSDPSTGVCALARAANVASSVFSCTCTNPFVFVGDTCQTCLAPEGAKCEEDGSITDCTGLALNSAGDAVAVDQCGVCGGDGMCRGCDGVPNSGLVYDTCGICGGNNACIGANTPDPVYVEYTLTFNNISEDASRSPTLASTIAFFCDYVRRTDSDSSTKPCLLESYLTAQSTNSVPCPNSLYEYAKSAGRMGEAVFTINNDGVATRWTNMIYRVKLSSVDASDSYENLFNLYQFLQANVVKATDELLGSEGINLYLTSTYFPPATAVVLSKQSLWFAVGIGLAVTFVFLLVFFVSVTAALGGTLVAGCVCFGTLTVCTMFPAWELDAVLQVCVSCTIPIGVEYVVHMLSGYFDYLQTTTSHLFARDLTRRTAVMGAMLRSMPAVCTCVVAVVLSSIAFDVSELVPSQRSGQVCITMHLVLAVAVFFFTGALAAAGPMKAYQHWTLSAGLCVLCAVLAAICIAIIYGAGGVIAPTGDRILSKNKVPYVEVTSYRENNLLIADELFPPQLFRC